MDGPLYEIAIEKGFDEADANETEYDAYNFYVLRWLREQRGVLIEIVLHPFSSSHGWSYNLINYRWETKDGFAQGTLENHLEHQADSVSLTYEQAMEQAIRKALELI